MKKTVEIEVDPEKGWIKIGGVEISTSISGCYLDVELNDNVIMELDISVEINGVGIKL